ncbi:MAG: LysM peptidoglycan-binding domain-containing protein [Deltaproteobacteria bacterium]|nr:LysM peptidoglycan-binding domain-containing protein [Deltaproteobacteria bacterium]
MKRKILAAALISMFLASSAVKADEVQVPLNSDEAQPKTEKAVEDTFTYTIVPRDTLWDISGKFLKNPFKWPKIWKLNPYIKNPDLIYPGNIVRITPNGIEVISKKQADIEKLPVVNLEAQDEKVTVLEPEIEEVAKEPIPAASPSPKVTSSAMARRGFITDKELKIAGAIIKPKEENILLMNAGDDVFISFKDRKDINVGDRFTIFVVADKIVHPVTEAKLGNTIDILGSLEITRTGNVIEGKINKSFKEIYAGAKLRSYKEPAMEVEITEPDSVVEGYVVASLEAKENLSEGDIAYIDKGIKDGIKKGNIMRVYREVESARDPLNQKQKIKLPPMELGTLVVLEADDNTSSCIVLKSVRVINWGDKVSTVMAD